MKALDKAWANCERMWKWISENLPDGFSEISEDTKDFIIDHLKCDWLQKNKFTKKIAQDCFFCEYDKKYGKNGDGCESCPAVLASPKTHFRCTDLDHSYAYEPIRFYNEISKLNTRRKEG